MTRLAALLGLALVLAAGCAEERGRPNVLVIVVDTLRADRLGCYGAERDTSPAIDGLAASGTLFVNAYVPSPWTKPSVASILTGRYPSGHGLTGLDRKLPKGARSIAQMLGDEGYRTAGVVSNRLIGKFGRGFETFDASEGKGPGHVSGERVTRKAIALAEELAADEAPFLLYVHYFDPHVDYKPHPDFGLAPERAGRLDGTQTWNELDEMRASLSEEELAFVRDLYDGEVRYTDEAVRDLLAALERLGIEDETIVVFTSDHGEELMEHGNIGHTRTLYEELIRVPFLVRAPGAPAGLRLEHPVSVVALVPTVLELCGVDAREYSFQQPSLAARIHGEPEPEGEAAIFAEVDFVPPKDPNIPVGETRKKSLRKGDWKIILDQLSDSYELYDLAADPGETRDLSEAEPERLEQLKVALDLAIEHAGQDALDPEELDLSPDEVEMLRSLGYVE